MPVGVDVNESEIDKVEKLAQKAGVTLEKEINFSTTNMVTVYPKGAPDSVDAFFNLFWESKRNVN